MDETTTGRLEKVLRKISDTKGMEAFLEDLEVSDCHKTFREYFRSLPQVHALTDTEMIQKSGIEKSYYYQIMKGTKNPGRDKVLRLCIGAGLSTRETIRCLELNGNALLYPKNRRDIILSVAIKQKASVDDANLLLDKYGEDPLK